MGDLDRGSAGDWEESSAAGPEVGGPRGSRRRWSAEEKARIVRESLRPGRRVGEVARRYGVSRWQLSSWRGLARAGKLAVPSSEVVAPPEPQPAFATVEVDSGPDSMGSVVIEARGVTVRLEGAIGAGRTAAVASVLRGLR